MLDDIRPDRQLDVAPPDGVSASDYHLIEDAVMDTARGRWFLREYARRIRKAETAQLLEALARIERSVEETKSRQSFADQGRCAITDSAAGAASNHCDNSGKITQTDAIAPVMREGLLAVQEKLLDIVWYMRERGFDGQLCSSLRDEAGKLLAMAGAPASEHLSSAGDASSASSATHLIEQPPKAFSSEVGPGSREENASDDEAAIMPPQGIGAESVCPEADRASTDRGGADYNVASDAWSPPVMTSAAPEGPDASIAVRADGPGLAVLDSLNEREKLILFS